MKYVIELTEKQIQVYRDALEFYSRFLSGQIDYLPSVIDYDRDISYKDKKEACDILKKVLFPELQQNEHNGVGIREKDEKSIDSTISYEMYREVYTQQNKEQRDKGNKRYSVYDRETIQFSDEPLPIVIPCIDL